MGIEQSESWVNVFITTSNLTSSGKPVGQIQALYPAVYQFSCRMNILYFPFDRQNCSMVFGSWTYDASGIQYFSALNYVRNESYVENAEWSVLSFQIIRHENSYTCCPHPYTELHAHLVIQRKPLYYIVNLVVPTTLIALIAVVGFFTPNSSTGERSEKLNLGVSTLMALSIFLLLVSDQMPRTSNFVPLIGWYFLCIIIIISVAVFVTTIIISIQQRGRFGHSVPGWAKVICFQCLSTILCVSPPKSLLKDTVKLEKQKLIRKKEIGKPNYFGRTLAGRSIQAEDNFGLLGDLNLNGCISPIMTRNAAVTNQNSHASIEQVQQSFPSNKTHDCQGKGVLYTTICGELEAVQKKMQQILVYFEARGEESGMMLQWEYLTTILDRFCLVVLISLILITTCVFLIIGCNNSSSN